MEFEGQKTIAAPPDKVWTALIDPVFLRRLIPGCESMEGTPETGYAITVVRKVGGMELRMAGRFALSDLRPAQGCLLSGSGSADAAGDARGTARIDLSPEGAGTRLGWAIAAEVGGRIAALPGFVVAMAARRVADGFVERFAAAVEGRKVEKKGWFVGLSGG